MPPKKAKEAKTKVDLAKKQKQDKILKKEAAEREKAWGFIALPAAQLVADLAAKRDLQPIELNEKLLNPTANWLEERDLKRKELLKAKESKYAGSDQDSEEESSESDLDTILSEQNKFVQERLDDEDELDDGLDEFRGLSTVKSEKRVMKPKLVAGQGQDYLTGGAEKGPKTGGTQGRHIRPSVSSDRILKRKRASSVSHGSLGSSQVSGFPHRATQGDLTGDDSAYRGGSIALHSDDHHNPTSLTGSGTDDEPWSNADDNEFRDGGEMKSLRPTYELIELDIQPDEAMRDLEDLLDELQMEARITERYKYKLINRFSLFLQALIAFQEREIEMIENINLKWKILDVLNDFVKLEAEEANKIIIAEEKQEKEEEGQGLILDLSSRADGRKGNEDMLEGDEIDKSATQDSHGLSIEEMPATVIRETLLQQRNRLEIQDDLRRIQVLETKQLEFEKTLLSLHYNRMIKPVDLQREMKDARRGVNDLENEISQMQQEMSQLQTDISVEEKSIIDEEKNVEKIELEALTKQNEVQQNSNKPVHLSKEADREAHRLEQLEDQISNVNTKYMDDFDEMRILQNRIDKLMSELNALIKDESKMHRMRKNSLHETENLLAQMENLVSREQSLLERAAAMSEKISNTIKQKKKLQEEFHQISNEANKAHREGQRIERTMRISSEAYLNSKLSYDKMKAAYDATRPKNEENTWEKLSRMFNREIRNLKNALNKKLGEASLKANVVETLQQELNELYENQLLSGRKLQDMIKMAVKKRHERDEKSEQCIQLEHQINKLLAEKKTQDIALEDLLRAEADYKGLLRQRTDDCHKAKLAKAAMITDLVNARDGLAATNEKLASLEKEVELVVAEIKTKEQQLGEIYYVTLNAILTRDSERNAALRNRDKFRRHRIEKTELLIDTKTLRREINKQKSEIIQIRREYEKSHSGSCKRAIKVRERTEEICTFTENIRLYNQILLQGAAAITIREMELSKLKALYEEVHKHILIVKMNQPDEAAIIQRIESLRETFYKTTDERRALEQRLNEDDSPQRVREIRFDLIEKIENYDTLKKRLERAESELASRDALGLERTLVEKQLDDNIAQFIQHAKYLKNTYSEDVKVLVNLRKRLATISRRIDGMICETSIAIGKSDTAEKEYFKLKDEVVLAQQRLEHGLVPSEEIEREWEHQQWKEKMLARSRLPKGNFLTKAKRLTGSQILMERMRPKPKVKQICNAGPDLNTMADKNNCTTMKLAPPKKLKHATGIGKCNSMNCASK